MAKSPVGEEEISTFKKYFNKQCVKKDEGRYVIIFAAKMKITYSTKNNLEVVGKVKCTFCKISLNLVLG